MPKRAAPPPARPQRDGRTPQRRRKPRGLGHERRDEILAAAKELFVADGYETVTTRKLAQRVGLSQTALYVYFASKEQILDALCKRSFVRLAERMRKATERATLGPDSVRRLVAAYVDFALEHPDEYQITFLVSPTAWHPSHRKDVRKPIDQQGPGMQAFLLLREELARLREAGLLATDDVTVATQTAWAAVHGLASLLIARPAFPWAKRRRLVDSLAETLIRGLLVSPPRTRRD